MIYQNFLVGGEPYLTNGELYNVRASSFNLLLYQNKAESNRLDKTNYIELIGNITGVLRNECSIISPVIEIEMDDIPTFNYVYIPVFNRYYFVDNIVSVRNRLWRISMSVDVLMSFKEQILKQYGFIKRNEFSYNQNLVDDKVPTQNNPIINYYEVQNTILNPRSAYDGFAFVLTVLG